MATTNNANAPRPPLNPAIRPGLVGEVELTVAEEHLAPHTPKFSTPAMVMLMEQASFAAVRPLLAESQTVVGYEVNVKHLAPAGAGSWVTGTSTLMDVSGNKLRFEVVARLGDVILGTAEHKMAVVPQSDLA
ncbi:MAG: thioesterase [Chloroflexi bacterium]|nr:thioesterase [Chloroflexota bacterium]